jgi:uncharacterized protein
MKKITSLLLACACMHVSVLSQQFILPQKALARGNELDSVMPALAAKAITQYRDSNHREYLNTLFRLQSVAGDYDAAVKSIAALRTLIKGNNGNLSTIPYIQYDLYSKAKKKQASSPSSFAVAFNDVFTQTFQQLSDLEATNAATAFLTSNGIGELQNSLERTLQQIQGKESINLKEFINLCKSYYLVNVYRDIEPLSKPLLKQDDNRRYIIEDSVLIKTKEGATISACVVRKRNLTTPQPAVLFFFIYSDTIQILYEAKQSAARGYVGVVADTRGKRLSPDPIEPYEHEPQDVNSVIDWISKQSWCNGKIGMYGGSYSGYAQWAATKHMHPALKTIVPYVAAIPGQGVPMENNIFLNVNYGWAFYVTNNKYLDNETYYDRERWDSLPERWYKSGVAFRKIDSIDKAPNKWLQRWLQHPSYDKYWQNMVPYKEEYAKINIPVLSITGYYDDGQISALHYLKEHYKYNKKADHYLIIGPYDHFGAQRGGVGVLREYAVDPVALIDTRQITYDWLDHILRGGPKPAILKDKINYQVMGTNSWRHAASLEKMNKDTLKLYLSTNKPDSNYRLSNKKLITPGFIYQQVDLADRSSSNNSDYYPYPIIKGELDRSTGLFFISDPFTEPVAINGTFSGLLKASINKKDMDIGITLYEVLPDGRYFHLSYFIGRASYAKDMSTRHLLTPGKIETIPIERSRLVSKQIGKGSRLFVVLDINKHSYAQVNFGTGKDVSDETIEDGKEPLKIKWYSDSFLRIPVLK